MPDRMVREAARFSERLEKVSVGAELMFWRFLTVPDDFGIYPADTAELRSAIWPANRRHLRLPDVARWRDELVQAGVLGLFEVNGARFVELMRFRQAEKLKHPRRRFPRPPSEPDDPGQAKLPLTGANAPPCAHLDRREEKSPQPPAAAGGDSNLSSSKTRRTVSPVRRLKALEARLAEVKKEVTDLRYPGGCAHVVEPSGEKRVRLDRLVKEWNELADTITVLRRKLTEDEVA